ncbi:MAG: vanadium-dependent haloperoxidase [Kineosporiaceae bacterium]|nr:vanadium-dependent haloperoxidase [Kineosporiaceae bacterium]
MTSRWFRIGTVAASVTLTGVLVAAVGQAVAAGRHSPPPTETSLAASTAVQWQRTASRTVFAEGALAPPSGALYLAFTSLAVHEAAQAAQRHGPHAATAAVTTAAHDVLAEYFPASRTGLARERDASLARVPQGRMRAEGIRLGERAADAMISSRYGDGRGAPVVYTRSPAPGIWQPPPDGSMALAWLGAVRPVVDIEPVAVDGPDPLRSKQYAADFREVVRVGGKDSTVRTAEQTAIATFFAANPVPVYREAVCRYLDGEPQTLLATTRLFARMDSAVATAFIRTWRLKFDIGFWRPFQAIPAADSDANPATHPRSDWAPLVTNPSYPDYVSGHAAATSPVAQILRRTFGDATPLTLQAGGQQRRYASLSDLEHEALNARIWGGLHFRDAMEDGYRLGHLTADRVMAAIR